MSDEYVLGTGGRGFLGARCVVWLPDVGYRVSTTVRAAGRTDEVLADDRFATCFRVPA
jgi:hypothetical protein